MLGARGAEVPTIALDPRLWRCGLGLLAACCLKDVSSRQLCWLWCSCAPVEPEQLSPLWDA